MREILDVWKNPVTFAAPFFLITIGIELAALKWLDHDNNMPGVSEVYVGKDARTSIFMGIGSLVSSVVMKVIGFFMYIGIYLYVAPFHMPTGSHDWWSWIVMVLEVDFFYYWQHRFVHRARVGWAAHQAHHSSEYMNFATALRQKWNPWWELIFWLPLPFVGVAPWALFLAWGVNLVYQFFVHTETVGKLWAPIEYVFNTPSHHRVHHGADPEYLDKNYAGILIIWDRFFGTFQPETHRPTYGLTHPVNTYNLIKLQYGDYADLWRDVKAAPDLRTRVNYLFKPPGWQPEEAPATTEARTA